MSQRRHRAAYLAPSSGARPWLVHPDDYDNDDYLLNEEHDEEEARIPLLVEVPSSSSNHRSTVSPPTSGELLGTNHDLIDLPAAAPQKEIHGWMESIVSCYRALIDLVLVVAMCLIGCILYDVDVQVVKSTNNNNRKRARDRRRVFIRNELSRSHNRRGQTTTLLRSPSSLEGSASPKHWGFV
eukprot:scaffold1869_cov122-Cylindrotheca_fusiformis.AAC.46